MVEIVITFIVCMTILIIAYWIKEANRCMLK